MASLKRLLVGSPIRTERLTHERITKKTALAVFSSDALSSTAYATEEILLVLAAAYMVGQTQAFSRVVPITIGIASLLVIVASRFVSSSSLSSRLQTCAACASRGRCLPAQPMRSLFRFSS